MGYRSSQDLGYGYAHALCTCVAQYAQYKTRGGRVLVDVTVTEHNSCSGTLMDQLAMDEDRHKGWLFRQPGAVFL